jgi:hypothetical protein
MKLTSQMPSSTSVLPNRWSASTVEMLIFFLCMQMRPHAVQTSISLGQATRRRLRISSLIGAGAGPKAAVIQPA